jgi:hypothetical protein
MMGLSGDRRSVGCVPELQPPRLILRLILDSMTMRYIILKVFGYLRKMYEKFLDNLLYGVNIQKNFCFVSHRG